MSWRASFSSRSKEKSRKHLKAGESVYLPPNAVHRGLSGGEEPVKLFVVRIKPADKPLAVDVDPPASP
jgi:quercetin dioxygenase-like cupin family protein